MNETVTHASNAIHTLSPTGIKQTRRASSECKICGASAQYSYYGAIVCVSCKVFFRRNAEAGQVN